MAAARISAGPVLAANDEPLARAVGPLDHVCQLGGDGAAMTGEAVSAWIAAAEAGAQIVYAIGHLPAWSKGPARMRDAAAAGLVHLFHDRRPTPKHYVAVRSARALAAAAAKPRGVARPVPNYDPHLGALYDLLRAMAADGTICPSNGELAAELGLSRAQAASYLMGCLAKAGRIRVETARLDDGRFHRTVTITGTGRSTAGPGA